MNKYGVFLTVLLPLCGFAEAQEVVTVETPAAAAIAEPTVAEAMRDFVRAEETRVCGELRKFARENIFADSAFMAAANDRNTRKVAAAASKYAVGLAKDFDVDFVFYHPNTRFFVRVNDAGYRGRMRLPAETTDTFSTCFWERLPSQDVVYSMLAKIDGEKTGYLKISKKLTRMIKNVPDALSSFGKVRVYTALDKSGLKKRLWFKMRRREPDKVAGSGWCSSGNLAFLSTVGSGVVPAKKQQKSLLAAADEKTEFDLPLLKLKGGALSINGLDGERLGEVIVTLETGTLQTPAKDDVDDGDCDEKTENFLYRFFE